MPLVRKPLERKIFGYPLPVLDRAWEAKGIGEAESFPTKLLLPSIELPNPPFKLPGRLAHHTIRKRSAG